MVIDIRNYGEPRKVPDLPEEPEGLDHGPHPADQAWQHEEKNPKVRAKASDRAVRLVLGSGAELWHDHEKSPFISVTNFDHRENYAIRCAASRMWIMRLFFESEGRGLSRQECNDALLLLEAKAIFEGNEHLVAVRVAHLPDQVVLDLGGPDWKVIVAKPSGWQINSSADLPVRFRRPTGLLALPNPKPGGDLNCLRLVLNTDEDGICEALAWLVFSLGGRGPYPILALAGEQGTGKSTTARVLRELIDPISVGLRTIPREERDLAIAARNAHVLAFDNLSSISEWLSDALCRLATGAGFATRTLFSDHDEVLFCAKRPIIVNGIPDLMTRGDMADRAMCLTLGQIPDDQRMTEDRLWKLVDKIKPDILGGLLDAVVVALRRLPNLPASRLPRMADFARFVVAAEPALPWAEGKFVRTYAAVREDSAQVLLEGDMIHSLVVEILNKQARPVGAPEDCRPSWEGTAAELLRALNAARPDGDRPPQGWPRSAKGMGNHLRRIAPAMRQIGLEVSHSKGGGKMNARIITIRQTAMNDGKAPSGRSESSGNHVAQENPVRTVKTSNRPKQSDDPSVRMVEASAGQPKPSTVRQETPSEPTESDRSDRSDDGFNPNGSRAEVGDFYTVDL